MVTVQPVIGKWTLCFSLKNSTVPEGGGWKALVPIASGVDADFVAVRSKQQSSKAAPGFFHGELG